MQSLHLDFGQLMQTSLLVRLKNRFKPMFINSWQRDVSMALQGQSLPGTHRVTLCAQRSQMKSCLFQQTHHNKQTRAQSLRHSQILLHLCSALQSPIYSHSHTKHLSGLPFCSSQGTSTEYWSLILTIYLSLNKSMWGRILSKTQATVDYYFLSRDAHT